MDLEVKKSIIKQKISQVESAMFQIEIDLNAYECVIKEFPEDANIKSTMITKTNILTQQSIVLESYQSQLNELNKTEVE